VFEGNIFFSLKIYGKLAGLSNKFEPSMVFDPSEFEGPRFDLYICKMLISIFSCFFHTIFKDLTEQILYPKCNRMHHFASFWKTMFWGEGWQTLDPLPILVSRGLACMQKYAGNIGWLFKITRLLELRFWPTRNRGQPSQGNYFAL
jgi:hypothetical protein